MSFLSGAVVGDGLFYVDRRVEIFGEGEIDGEGFGELAGENGSVGFGDVTGFDCHLESACHFAVFGEDNEAGGFAVEAADEVKPFKASVFTASTDEAGEGSVFGGVADDPTGFVNDKKMIIFFENPGLEFLEVY